jgi:hypothetical protein
VFREEYGGGYQLQSNHHNEAILRVGEQNFPSSAAVVYTCQTLFVDVLKMTNGEPNTNFIWNFSFFNGPDGYTPDFSNLIGGVQSDIDPDGDGLLPLRTALNPTRTYSVCEIDIPSTWFARWRSNGQRLFPYNPDADPVDPEDTGNRCIDFGAGTALPLTAGTTTRFVVNNRNPGGEPRTPVYWMNWSRCDVKGNQPRRADRQARKAGFNNGQGWRVGFWLLDDVLNPSVGGGITWDDIQTDALQVPIESCEEAWEILGGFQVTLNGIVGDGKFVGTDPARKLSRQLLAAQANLAAGACRTQAVLDATLAAEVLLDTIDFDGTLPTPYLKGGARGQEALRLAGILQEYNRGILCGDPDPPQP